MKVQSCNNSPNFGKLRSTNCYGQFEGKYGEKIINALKEIPEFQELTQKTDVDVYVGNTFDEYRYVYGYDGLQETLTGHLYIAYDKAFSGKFSWIRKGCAKLFGATQSYIHRITTHVNGTSVTDEMVDKFISGFNAKPEALLSLRGELKLALKEIRRATDKEYDRECRAEERRMRKLKI